MYRELATPAKTTRCGCRALNIAQKRLKRWQEERGTNSSCFIEWNGAPGVDS